MTDRYFQAFVEIVMPWCSHGAWQPIIKDLFLFEQPDMPAHSKIIETARQNYSTAKDITLVNLHEISETDFRVFIGGGKEWEVSDK